MKLTIEGMDEVKVAFEMMRLAAEHKQQTGFEIVRSETMDEIRTWNTILQKQNEDLRQEVASYKEGHDWTPRSYREEQVITMTPADMRRVRTLPKIVHVFIRNGMVKFEDFETEGDPMELYRMATASMAKKL